MSDVYSRTFYENQMDGSLSSAAAIVPLVLSKFEVRSVVDFGCGVGTWLAEFARHGVGHYLGIDGDYVDGNMLMIPRERFIARDLREIGDLGETFDLACSVEVAEHLPPESARLFVAALVKSAPVVLFSAAIPGQGGDGHINEQWPSYWAKLFREHGYAPLDFIRENIIEDDRTEWWYRQNVLMFCRPEKVPAGLSVEANDRWLDRVDPCYYERVRNEISVVREQLFESEDAPYATGLSRLPWRVEREFAKFLCTIGLTRDGGFLWRRADVRRDRVKRRL
jgi:SAM-dependent methyltransferase